jgi:hypothetical protein
MHLDRAARFALVGLNLFLGVNALFGAVAVVPALPPGWLAGTPFSDYTIPALALGAVGAGARGRSWPSFVWRQGASGSRGARRRPPVRTAVQQAEPPPAPTSRSRLRGSAVALIPELLCLRSHDLGRGPCSAATRSD